MGRRTFLIGGVAALAAPLVAQAQQARTLPHLGVILSGSASIRPSLPELDAFIKQLAALGWIDGQTLLIDWRWAEGAARLAELAAELVGLNARVIFAAGPRATEAARAATSMIPIVMVASSDPNIYGIASLSRPGGNLTGLTIGPPEVVMAKRLSLLKEMIPGLFRIAVLWDVPRSREEPALARVFETARSLSLHLQQIDVAGPDEFERAFEAARKEKAQAVLLIDSPRAISKRSVVAALALKSGLPMMSQFSAIVESGGLIAYGADLNDLFRRAAGYVDKILKGARPADLPVEEPSRYTLVINLKTAKALGLTIPPSLLARADQVIE
jgi:putative ABC transport system substrate-binding protein